MRKNNFIRLGLRLRLRSKILTIASVSKTPTEPVPTVASVASGLRLRFLQILSIGALIFMLTITHANSQDTLSHYQTISNSFQVLEFVTAKFADIQQDEKMDLVYSGIDNAGFPVTYVYLQDDLGFGAAPFQSIPLKATTISFSDITNDGFGDLLLYGWNNLGEFQLHIAAGDSLGTLSQIEFDHEVPTNGALTVADLNNDGKKEILITGQYRDGIQLIIYEITESGFEPKMNLPGIFYGSMVTLDSDNNGRNDILLTGRDSLDQYNTFFLSNKGNWKFELVENTIQPLTESDISIGT